jgi:transposase
MGLALASMVTWSAARRCDHPRPHRPLEEIGDTLCSEGLAHAVAMVLSDTGGDVQLVGREADIVQGPPELPSWRWRGGSCAARGRCQIAAGQLEHAVLDATVAPGLATRPGRPSRCIGRTKGGLNSKLHAARDGQGRPVSLLLSEGQLSDHRGARLLLTNLPSACDLIADRGYDSNHFRAALLERGTTPCIPPTRSRSVHRRPLHLRRATSALDLLGAT